MFDEDWDDEQEEKKPLKVFIEFENKTFDFSAFKGLTTHEVYNSSQPQFMGYVLIVELYASPYEVVFEYASAELRENKIAQLKSKLEKHRFLFL